MASIEIAAGTANVCLPTTPESWHRAGLTVGFSLGDVSFAQFRMEDAGDLLEIRNHPTVRPFMPSAEPLPLETHMTWVRSQLLARDAASPVLLIGRDGDRPVGFGVVKALPEPDVMEVGVMVVGEWQHGTLPPRLAAAMATVASRLFGARVLQTYVNRSHEQAIRFNRGWGLQETASKKPGELCFRAPTAAALSTPLCRRWTRGLRLRIGHAPSAP